MSNSIYENPSFEFHSIDLGTCPTLLEVIEAKEEILRLFPDASINDISLEISNIYSYNGITMEFCRKKANFEDQDSNFDSLESSNKKKISSVKNEGRLARADWKKKYRLERLANKANL